MRAVKRFESGMVVNPITITPTSTLATAQELMALSYSCYEGKELHCGLCGTCQERRAAFRDAKNTYTLHNRNPGDGPNGPETQNPICEENALDALTMAAKDYPWRANAAHVVILATDDTFIEGGDNYGAVLSTKGVNFQEGHFEEMGITLPEVSLPAANYVPCMISGFTSCAALPAPAATGSGNGLRSKLLKESSSRSVFTVRGL